MAADERVDDTDFPLFSIRVLATSKGYIGVDFAPLAGVLPWTRSRWVSPDQVIRVKGGTRGLAPALLKAGLPVAEARELAEQTMDEWETKAAAYRSARARQGRPRLGLRYRAFPHVLAFFWSLGVTYTAIRAWRALR
jgi:hypothetical protein